MGSASLGYFIRWQLNSDRHIQCCNSLEIVTCCERVGNLHYRSLRFLCGQPVFMHEWRGTLVRIVPGPVLTTQLFVLDATFIARSRSCRNNVPSAGWHEVRDLFWRRSVQMSILDALKRDCIIFNFCVSAVKIHVEHMHFFKNISSCDTGFHLDGSECVQDVCGKGLHMVNGTCFQNLCLCPHGTEATGRPAEDCSLVLLRFLTHRLLESHPASQSCRHVLKFLKAWILAWGLGRHLP